MNNSILIEDKLKEELIKALSIKERLLGLKQYEDVSSIDNRYIEKWKARRSLVDDKMFSLKLEEENISEDEFNCAIKELNEEEKKVLIPYLEECSWFKTFEEIFKLFDKVDCDKRINVTSYDMSYIVRPFIYWVEEKINSSMSKLKKISLAKEVKEELLNSIRKELSSFVQKSFIIELHIAKDKEELKGEKSEDRFKYFVKNNFTSRNGLMNFYSKYAVLARLLTVRTGYYIDNTVDSIVRLDKNLELIKKRLGLNINSNKIVKIIQAKGDSHQKGKAVSQFIFEDNTKIIYKPKNLKIEQAYYKFINWINNNYNLFKLPIIKGVYKDEYSFEECIEYKQCTKEEEIENFYERFGQTIGIVYILCGTDFHLENVFACGEYPYLIDMETLFQNQLDVKFNGKLDGIKIEASRVIYNSVLESAILPSVYHNNEGGQDVDISGLNGDEQKLPEKVLVPVDVATDNMKYEYREAISDGGCNIPMLNNKKVKYQKYIKYIVKGFENLLLKVMENKEDFFAENSIFENFKDKQIRSVIKDTKRYVELLNFSLHPSCTQNFIEREKLLDNMWAYPYKNKAVIKYEIKDMLYHDVPIFYSKVDSKNLWSSTGGVIQNFYAETGYTRALDRIRNLDLKEIDKELSYMTVAFDQYDYRSNKILDYKNDQFNNVKDKLNSDILVDYVKESMKIGDNLMDRVIYSKNKDMITWIDIIKNVENKKAEVVSMGIDFYDGLSGVAMYYYYLYKVTENYKYKNVYESLINTIFNSSALTKDLSAFQGKISLLNFLLVIYKDEHKYLDKINEIYEVIKSKVQEEENESYINHLSNSTGVIQELLNAYDILEDKKYLQLADSLGQTILTIIENMNIKELLEERFHEVSGISFIFFKLYSYTKNDKYEEAAFNLLKFNRRLFEEKKDEYINKQEKSYDWCSGFIGSAMSRVMMKNYYRDDRAKKEVELAVNYINGRMMNDDCLAYGNMRDIDFLLLCKKYDFKVDVDTIVKEKLENIFLFNKYNGSFRIKSLPQIESVGLFTGLCSVGYELLRVAFPDKVPSVCALEV